MHEMFFTGSLSLLPNEKLKRPDGQEVRIKIVHVNPIGAFTTAKFIQHRFVWLGERCRQGSWFRFVRDKRRHISHRNGKVEILPPFERGNSYTDNLTL